MARSVVGEGNAEGGHVQRPHRNRRYVRRLQRCLQNDALPDPCRWLLRVDQSPADGGKDPWHIFLPEHKPFSFAGLWAYNRQLAITSCTIITMPAGEPMRQIHDRQPVILDPAAYDAWLDPETPAGSREGAALAHNLDGELQFHRVSRTVNSVKNQGGDCIEPINPL